MLTGEISIFNISKQGYNCGQISEIPLNRNTVKYRYARLVVILRYAVGDIMKEEIEILIFVWKTTRYSQCYDKIMFGY